MSHLTIDTFALII